MCNSIVYNLITEAAASVNYVTKRCVPYVLATVWTNISIKCEIHFCNQLQVVDCSCKLQKSVLLNPGFRFQNIFWFLKFVPFSALQKYSELIVSDATKCVRIFFFTNYGCFMLCFHPFLWKKRNCWRATLTERERERERERQTHRLWYVILTWFPFQYNSNFKFEI